MADALAERDPRARRQRAHRRRRDAASRPSTGRAPGVVADGVLHPHDHVVSTLLRPQLRPLLAPELARALGPDPNRYLGVVCLVARVRKTRQPVLRAEHHRPPRAADERRRDDARRRPRGASAATCSTCPATSMPDSPGARAPLARDPRRLPRRPAHHVPRLRRARTSSPPRSPAPASRSRSGRPAPPRPSSSPRRGSRSPAPPTPTRTSCTGRRSSASPSGSSPVSRPGCQDRDRHLRAA